LGVTTIRVTGSQGLLLQLARQARGSPAAASPPAKAAASAKGAGHGSQDGQGDG